MMQTGTLNIIFGAWADWALIMQASRRYLKSLTMSTVSWAFGIFKRYAENARAANGSVISIVNAADETYMRNSIYRWRKSVALTKRNRGMVVRLEWLARWVQTRVKAGVMRLWSKGAIRAVAGGETAQRVLQVMNWREARGQVEFVFFAWSSCEIVPSTAPSAIYSFAAAAADDDDDDDDDDEILKPSHPKRTTHTSLYLTL
jgi:hypothetical protein